MIFMPSIDTQIQQGKFLSMKSLHCGLTFTPKHQLENGREGEFVFN